MIGIKGTGGNRIQMVIKTFWIRYFSLICLLVYWDKNCEIFPISWVFYIRRFIVTKKSIKNEAGGNTSTMEIGSFIIITFWGSDGAAIIVGVWTATNEQTLDQARGADQIIYWTGQCLFLRRLRLQLKRHYRKATLCGENKATEAVLTGL